MFGQKIPQFLGAFLSCIRKLDLINTNIFRALALKMKDYPVLEIGMQLTLLCYAMMIMFIAQHHHI